MYIYIYICIARVERLGAQAVPEGHAWLAELLAQQQEERGTDTTILLLATTIILLLTTILLLGNGVVYDLWAKRTFSKYISKYPSKTSYCQQHTCSKQRLIFNTGKTSFQAHWNNTFSKTHESRATHIILKMLPLLGACCWCLDMATHIILNVIPLLCA